MSDLKLFISHKHSDREIGKILADFVKARSNSKVGVYLSSSPDFEGPKFGSGLNPQLRKALWESEALLLVYTSADQDWQYCMWECGVATHPESPDTKIIVFQCGSDVPAPFGDVLRVNARSYDDIEKFTDQFLRSSDFFAKSEKAVAPELNESFVKEAARTLYDKIIEVLPPPAEEGLGEEWTAWPYLKIELPRAEVEKMRQAKEIDSLVFSRQIISEHGLIAESDGRVAQLFGQTSFAKKMKFESLLSLWKDSYPDGNPAWFDSCCEQIMVGAKRGFPFIRRATLKYVEGEASYTPVLSRIRQVPFAKSVQFDIYFYNLSDPRAMPVSSRMIPKGEFFYEDLGKTNPQSRKLKDLIKELDQRQLNRIPILNGDGHPMYIVHRSMIDKFFVNQILSGENDVNPTELTLADLLADSEMKDMFEATFVVVKNQATLADAKSLMMSKAGCSDVFVTAGGERNEPVQGWLTNVTISQIS